MYSALRAGSITGRPVDHESAYRGLVAAMIARAMKDLQLSTWQHDAAYWLANEGTEWALLIDIDLDGITVKGQRSADSSTCSKRIRNRRSHDRHTPTLPE